MLERTPLLITLVMTLFASTQTFAAKAPLSPDELDEQADVVMVGKVERYRTDRRVMEGEERTQVTLYVVVESVEKGDPGDVGRTMTVRCDRLTRMSPFMLPTHDGNESIPAPGSRAKFFLAGGSALAPNGIEVLDGGAELDLPMKPAWQAFLEWPLLIVPLVVLVLIALLITLLTKKRAKSNGD
jgi:hypothetical protein